MIRRDDFLNRLEKLFKIFPVVAILGPRQCGKSTLAKQYIQDAPHHYFDLENELDLGRLKEAQLTLANLSGLIVIDEIQRRPDLFPTLRYLVDHTDQRYLILGSAAPTLLQQSSESLAGRIAYIELTPLSLHELDTLSFQDLWWRGGFPRSYLAHDAEASQIWRKEYIKTFIERDLAMMGIDAEPLLIKRFWQMLSFYHAQIFHPSEIADNLGIAHKTVQRYIDILEGTFMVRQLHPWYENIGKRQVRSRKIYIRDSGLLHSLLDINALEVLQGHPKLGASFEGFALEEIIRFYQTDTCYFWSAQNQAELDLLIHKDGKKLGFEFKYASAPTVTKSMRVSMECLKLDHLTIITPTGKPYPLDEKITVCGVDHLTIYF